MFGLRIERYIFQVLSFALYSSIAQSRDTTKIIKMLNSEELLILQSGYKTGHRIVRYLQCYTSGGARRGLGEARGSLGVMENVVALQLSPEEEEKRKRAPAPAYATSTSSS